MKAKYVLIGFILLTLGTFCATVNTSAANYELGASENTEITNEVKIIDENRLEELFQPVDLEDGGKSWRENLDIDINADEIGAKYKIKVDWINESDTYVVTDEEEVEDVEIDVWEVYIDIWNWVDPDNDFNPEPDYEERQTISEQDPDDLNMQYYNDDPDVEDFGLTVDELPSFVPIPVADYLDELDWQDDDWIPTVYYAHLNILGSKYDSELDEDDFEWDWSVDGNVVTCEKSFVWDEDPETASWDGDTEIEDYIEEWTYDESTGAISLYQIMTDDEEVIYEIGIIAAIPGYELPILLGVTTAFTIGLIYVIRKRN